MDAPDAPSPRPRRRRGCLIGCGAGLVLAVVAALVATVVLGPRLGVWLVPPSPERYASYAIDRISAGYFATGAEWERAKGAALAAGAQAESYADTHASLEAALKVAGGAHSAFHAEPQQHSTVGDGSAMPTVTHEDGITTIVLPAAGGSDRDFIQAYADTVAGGMSAAPADTCGVVVDVRGNTGGNMWPMIAGLTPVLPDGVFMRFRGRDGGDVDAVIDGGAAQLAGMTQASVENPAELDLPVAVLTDERTASSAEAVVTAFRGDERFRTFGAPTAGYTSGNEVVTLPDEAWMMITTSLYVDRAGVVYGQQMLPDEAVPADEAPDAAERWLRQRCGA